MARMINTVTGPVSSDALGGVLCHEHVVFGYPGYEGDLSFDCWNEEEFFDRVIPVIDTIKSQGIGTIVDATATDCGRRVEILKKVSERCGINIICATGYYYEHGGAPAYWRFRKAFGYDVDEEIYGLMKRELNEGVRDTGIKAGIIKVGSGIGEITDYEQQFFRAAARLAKEDPGVRIVTHCTHGTMLREQADLFLELGVNPKQVQLGHFCDTVDLSAQHYTLSKGFYGAFDRMGQVNFDGMPFDHDRMAAICGLVAAGFGDQLMLSHDRIYWFHGREVLRTLPDWATESLLKEWHWTYVTGKVLPKLREMGLTEEQTHKLIFENPAAFYGGA